MATLYPRLYSILNSTTLPNIPTTNSYYNEVILNNNVPNNGATNTLSNTSDNWSTIKTKY